MIFSSISLSVLSVCPWASRSCTHPCHCACPCSILKPSLRPHSPPHILLGHLISPSRPGCGSGLWHQGSLAALPPLRCQEARPGGTGRARATEVTQRVCAGGPGAPHGRRSHERPSSIPQAPPVSPLASTRCGLHAHRGTCGCRNCCSRNKNQRAGTGLWRVGLGWRCLGPEQGRQEYKERRNWDIIVGMAIRNWEDGQRKAWLTLLISATYRRLRVPEPVTVKEHCRAAIGVHPERLRSGSAVQLTLPEDSKASFHGYPTHPGCSGSPKAIKGAPAPGHHGGPLAVGIEEGAELLLTASTTWKAVRFWG
ncbi:uncharacterized protein LOC134476927 [Cavia porcellus]|uniref:uncharacterized protein LOC134476927 n=1 Tax=Cavia porcellus TaxID=10141 RepID=UPI002FE2C5EC